MKKFPKAIQCDKRGTIVIPRDIRQELGIDESTGFWVYSIEKEGILLKKIPDSKLTEDDDLVKQLKEKSSKIGMDPKNIKKTVVKYKRKKEGNLDLI